jgi:hypothetical protein
MPFVPYRLALHVAMEVQVAAIPDVVRSYSIIGAVTKQYEINGV